MYLTAENILLIGSILIFSAIIISKAGYKFGVPALLLFLLVGMAFGSDGLGLVFNNYHQAQFVGVAALSVILFTGGMETNFSDIRPVLKQGIVLATIGVFLTTLFCGLFIFFLTRIGHLSRPISIIMCFLMASVMSSTDSASVFNILKNSKIRLKENIRPMLELESGSNDPMAYVITIVLIQAAGTLFDPAAMSEGIEYWPMIWKAILTFIMQLGLGSLIGIGIGYGASWFLERIKLGSSPLYAILLLTSAFFTISITEMLKGNGYLAVYISGLIIGNKMIPNRKEILTFMDGMTWLMQIGMFLLLGLLVNPHEMISIAPMALLIGLFLILVARPAAVFLCLLPFRNLSFRAKSFVSWVGLKGAVPIIFAIYPIMAGIPGSNQIFNVVFFITILSLVIQGITVPKAARILHLALPMNKKTDTFGIEIPDEAGKLIDCTLSEDDLQSGNTLKEISLPEGARVVMIQRRSRLIVPDGSIELMAGDKLLMIFGENSETE